VVQRFTVYAPNVGHISLFVQRCRTSTVSDTAMQRQAGGLAWEAEAEAEDGDTYWFVADGIGPLLDPDAMDVVITGDGPRSVVRTNWPKQPSLGLHHRDPVVYELHVRGFA
jgi:1,4-alpha-glucan branching enzyme